VGSELDDPPRKRRNAAGELGGCADQLDRRIGPGTRDREVFYEAGGPRPPKADELPGAVERVAAIGEGRTHPTVRVLPENEVEPGVPLANGSQLPEELAGLLCRQRGQGKAEVVDGQNRVAVSERDEKLDRLREALLAQATTQTQVIEVHSRLAKGAR
jgi:hypothetical protein